MNNAVASARKAAGRSVNRRKKACICEPKDIEPLRIGGSNMAARTSLDINC
jgi:hypothetical protein